VFVAWVWALCQVWLLPDAHQFDFKTYYVAGDVYDAGASPWVLTNIREYGGNQYLLGFYYPPAVMHLLRPLHHLDYPDAHRLWLALKAAALLILFLVWKYGFLPRLQWSILLAVALFAFNGAMLWDVKSGNITAFEQMWLWVGLAFLLRARYNLFVFCVAAANIAKLFPALFLLLLWTPAFRSRANVVRSLAGLAGIGLVAFGPFLFDPRYLESFARAILQQKPPLHVNPSISGIVNEMARSNGASFLATGAMVIVPIVAYYGLIVASGWRSLRRTFGGADPMTTVLMFALLYALVAPRMIIYGYAVAIVPALALLVPRLSNRVVTAGAMVVALCYGGLQVFPGETGERLNALAPLLLLWACWLAVTRLVPGESAVEVAAADGIR
jgi:hypothetical protein